MNELTVGEIMERLVKGESLKEIAGKDPTSIRRRLTALGYEWDNSAKVWNWAGNGEQPLHINVFSGAREHKVKTTSAKREQVVKDTLNTSEHIVKQSSPQIHSIFTDDEILLLRHMMNEFKAKQEIAVSQPGLITELYERVQGLEPIPVEQKQRKTIVIDPNVGERFDQFVDKVKLNKGDLITLALEDFIKKYDV